MASVERLEIEDGTDDELLFDAAAWVTVARFLGDAALEHSDGRLHGPAAKYLGQHALNLGMIYLDTPSRLVPTIEQWPVKYTSTLPSFFSTSGMIDANGTVVPGFKLAHEQSFVYGHISEHMPPSLLTGLNSLITLMETHSKKVFEETFVHNTSDGIYLGSGLSIRAIHRDAQFYIGHYAAGDH